MSEALAATPEMDNAAALDAAFDGLEDGIDTETPDSTPEPTAEERAERARDDKGRFAANTAKKEEAKAEDPPPDTPKAPTDALKGPATTEAPAATPATEARPFQYRALGQTHALDGATLDAEGKLIVPAERVSTIREALNAHHMAQDGFKQLETYKARAQELEAQVNTPSVRQTQLERVLTRLAPIFDDPEALASLALNNDARGLLLRELGLEMRAAEIEHPHRTKPNGQNAQGQPETAKPAIPDRDQALSTTKEYIETARVEQKYPDLTAEDWKQFEARVSRTPFAFLRPTTAEEAKQYGLTPGQIVFDEDAFQAEVTEFATQTRTQRETAEQRAKRAADNARRTTPSVTVPPTTGGTKAPTGGPKAFTSKQDVDDWFDSDQLD